MIVASKLVILAVSASLLSGGAFVALTGTSGPVASGDYGVDTDRDGRFDWLVVTVEVGVDAPDYYNVWATLGTREAWGGSCYPMGPQPLEPGVPVRGGEYHEEDAVYPISWASSREFLEAGDHTIRVAFRGTDIGHAGVDGPYLVQGTLWADGEWEPTPRMEAGIMPEPSGQTWEYTTGPYDADAFETPRYAIQFTGTYADQGLDTDGDGLYDYLVLEAPAEVALAGAYFFDGTLFAQVPFTYMPTYEWMTSTYGTVEFAEGRQVLELRFNGGDIWGSDHSGSFGFSISVYYGGGGDDVRPDGTLWEGPLPEDGPEFDVYGDFLCGTTSEYRHDQWEELVEPATFTGVFADRGEDYDGDGLYDVLAVDAEVDVTEASAFEFSGQLLSEDGSAWIAGDWQWVYLDVGVQILTLHFSGPAIAASGVDGPYRVDISLVARRDPQATYVTGPYAYKDFDPDETTGRGNIWIADLSADASEICVTLERGPDLLAVVMDGTVRVQALNADGTLAFEGDATVSLPSGGDTVTVTFAWTPAPGEYVVVAMLESQWGTDALRIVVTV